MDHCAEPTPLWSLAWIQALTVVLSPSEQQCPLGVGVQLWQGFCSPLDSKLELSSAQTPSGEQSCLSLDMDQQDLEHLQQKTKT